MGGQGAAVTRYAAKGSKSEHNVFLQQNVEWFLESYDSLNSLSFSEPD